MRRSNPLAATLAGFVLTCFALTPTPASARETAPMSEPVQLVRAGDSQVSCAALAAEINQLASADRPQASVEAPARKKKGGFLRVLGHAAPFLGPLGMLGNGIGAAVASSAVGAAGSLGAASDSTAAMDQSRAAMQRALAGPSMESQRRERLTDMFEARRC